MAELLRVLFVCTGNIERSPYLERRARQLAGPGAAIEFASAGVPGTTGRPMEPPMAQQLTDRGADPTGHCSRPVTADLLAASDVVLTAEFAHRLRLLAAHPEHGPRIFGLRQAAQAVSPQAPTGPDFVGWLGRAALADSMTLDIADPHRRGRRAARACASELDDLLGVLLPALTGTPLDPVALRPPRTPWAPWRR